MTTDKKSTDNKEKNIYSRVALIFTILFGLNLIPMLVMGFYDFPSADDYGFGAYAHIAWHNTHNIFSVIAGACRTVYERYWSWQGTFSSIFMMALQPAVWSERAYFLSVWIILAMIIAPTLYFLYVIIIKIFKADRCFWLGLSMVMLLFDTQLMVDKTQGLYWFNGAAHYVISRGFALILLAILLKALYAGGKRGIGSFILAFWIGGCNLLTGLVMLILMACGMLIYWYFKDTKRIKCILVPFIFLAAAYAINVVSPGNYIRADEVLSDYGPVKSIILSLYYCMEDFTETWMGWEWGGLLALTVPFLWQMAGVVCRKFDYSFKFPWAVILFGYLTLASMYTPVLFAEGNPGAGRTYNIIFMDGVLWLLFDIFYGFGWIIRRLEVTHGLMIAQKLENTQKPKIAVSTDEGNNLSKEESIEGCLEKAKVWYWVGAGAVIFAFALLFTKVDINRYTTTSAVASIASGEAVAYADECREQIDTLKTYEGDLNQDVTIKRLENHPYLTFYEDIEPERDNWKNNLAVRFFQIGSLGAENNE